MLQKKQKRFKPSKSLSGILLMILHAIAMSALYVVAKNLMHSLHPNQVTFLYKFSILIAIIPWCMQGGLRHNLKTTKIGMHITRGTFSVMGTLCFFYGLPYIRALDAAAITYLEHILVLCIGIFYFKERFNFAKLLLICCGFMGALFVTKPGFQEFNKHYVFIFLALLFWAINNISIKVLGKTERTKAQLFYTMLFGSIIALPLALHDWKPIEPEHIKFILIFALLQLIHVVAVFKAFKFADISSVMPFDYSRLVFTGILGYIFLNEMPDKYSIIGYILIMFGGFYLIQDEARKKGLSRESETIATLTEEKEKKI